jgi:hypothetical protein
VSAGQVPHEQAPALVQRQRNRLLERATAPAPSAVPASELPAPVEPVRHYDRVLLVHQHARGRTEARGRALPVCEAGLQQLQLVLVGAEQARAVGQHKQAEHLQDASSSSF